MTVLYAILIFGLIIFVHELGHFVAAKMAKITVYQFTIGFGPAIFKKQIGETLYAVRLLPVGGAVMMKDINEDPPEGIDPAVWTSKGSFQEASWLGRFLVVIAGSLMNFISGILIVFFVLLPATYIAQPVISGFAQDFPLTDTFKEGDRIIDINGFHIFTYNDVVTALQLGTGDSFDFVVKRSGEKLTLSDIQLERKDYDGKGQLRYGINFGYSEISGFGKLKYAFNNALSFFQSAYKSIGMLFAGKANTSDLMGTVGIASEISERAEQSMADMWYFVAYLAVNLSFVNMLPIPGLDGGKLLFMLVELVRRKPLDPKWENYISYAGLGLILVLFVFITYNDIARLIAG
ncbi:MAG: M50 family metallopeptidase [Clostridiaceae bacterium]|nr:M50 family metallopeptidase [Clostridiaceae bacterium]